MYAAIRGYLIGIVMGVSTALFLLLMLRFAQGWIFFMLLLLWVALLASVAYLWEKHIQRYAFFLPLILCFAFSAIGLLLILEYQWMRVLIVLIVSLSIGLLYGWPKPSIEHYGKALRRFFVWVMLCTVYAAYSFFFALQVFFPAHPLRIVFVLFPVLWTVGMSFMAWSLYIKDQGERLWVWAALLGFLMAELLWVFALFPFAYLVLGFFATWAWYLMQLFVRFHLGEKGILWEKQWKFLALNGIVLFVLFAFFIRWI